MKNNREIVHLLIGVGLGYVIMFAIAFFGYVLPMSRGDINADGNVDGLDMSRLLSNYSDD